MIRFLKSLFCDHRWGNSSRLTLKYRTGYDRCRKCGASRKTGQ